MKHQTLGISGQTAITKRDMHKMSNEEVLDYFQEVRTKLITSYRELISIYHLFSDMPLNSRSDELRRQVQDLRKSHMGIMEVFETVQTELYIRKLEI